MFNADDPWANLVRTTVPSIGSFNPVSRNWTASIPDVRTSTHEEHGAADLGTGGLGVDFGAGVGRSRRASPSLFEVIHSFDSTSPSPIKNGVTSDFRNGNLTVSVRIGVNFTETTRDFVNGALVHVGQVSITLLCFKTPSPSHLVLLEVTHPLVTIPRHPPMPKPR